MALVGLFGYEPVRTEFTCGRWGSSIQRHRYRILGRGWEDQWLLAVERTSPPGQS